MSASSGSSLQWLTSQPACHKKYATDSEQLLWGLQAFLSLCQGNHFQFDTLRRAKHSSMMVLYHLHNPNAPAFYSSCNACNCEIEPGAGYRCTVCTDYDICTNCYNKGTHGHPHPLQVLPSLGLTSCVLCASACQRNGQRQLWSA